MHFRGAEPKDKVQQAPTSNPPAHNKVREVEKLLTLKQACPSEYQRAQGAFKDSMIH